jgi:transposase
LSQEDKRDMARRIYHATSERERDEKKKRLAKILSVSERTVRDWLSRIDKDSKEARNRRIFDMWLACDSGSEIAKACGLSEGEVSKTLSSFQTEDLPDGKKPLAEHASDFDPPIYNVWKQQEKTPGMPR